MKPELSNQEKFELNYKKYLNDLDLEEKREA